MMVEESVSRSVQSSAFGLRQDICRGLKQRRIHDAVRWGRSFIVLLIIVHMTAAVAAGPDAAAAVGDESRPSDQTILWDPDIQLPASEDMPSVPDVQFHVIKAWEPDRDGYYWLHGIALAWHDGRLYASFGHNKGHENTLTEEGRYCVSDDGGQTWSKIRTIDTGTEAADLAISHGVFHSHEKSLWALLGAFHGTRQRVHMRAYRLDADTGHWQSQGVVAKEGFWPMDKPVAMQNGRLIIPGLIVGGVNTAGVAIGSPHDPTSWRVVKLDASGVEGVLWGESALLVDGATVRLIVRYGHRATALTAVSSDFGESWTPLQESNLPMTTSKPAAGRLSTGQNYLICTTTADAGKRRHPLTIALSRPGENTFSSVFVIRPAVFPDGPGESHRSAALSYPYAFEHEGRLYIGYSNSGGRRANQNSAELAVVPVATLARLAPRR